MNGCHLDVLKLKVFVFFVMCSREGSIYLSPTHNLLSNTGKTKSNLECLSDQYFPVHIKPF